LKKLTLTLFFLTIIFGSFSLAQKTTLFIPRNIKKSYENGIRNYNGTPGAKYWQNKADYFISAEIVPKTRGLNGREEVIYQNNSSDELKKIVFRLYPDYYKKGAPRDDQIAPRAVNDGMVIKSLIINDDTINVASQGGNFLRRGTNATVFLNNPIPPGGKAVIEVEWSFVIPTFSKQRMGAYDSTSFFVAYWYPQIAVYDDVDGWDTYNYGGTVEFYNDFNNYNVEISVPEGFLVWATGKVQNLDELLKPKYLERIKKAEESDSAMHIVTKEDYAKGSPTIEDNYNTWIFKARNVTDFTFGTSDHYLWDMGSVVVDSNGRRVTVDAAYKEDSGQFYKVCNIAIKSIEYLSKELPGVPFPYPKMTIFNGAGGMESPMMVNEGSSSSYTGQLFVTSHEITHTYFPFYMGINERKYAWMDEGMATMLPYEFQKNNGKFDPLVSNIVGYSNFAGKEIEMPMMIPSVFLFGNAYRMASYGRPGIAYWVLEDMLGKAKFKKALKEYIKRWHGKHPLPYDFFFTFDNVSEKKLDWFWKPWFFERGFPDPAIKKVKTEKGKSEITIVNNGIIPVPVDVVITFSDSTTKKLHYSADVWKNRNKFKVNLSSKKEIIKVELLSARMPDVEKENNLWEVK
jgi:curved DNA-binding protein CbpA